MYLELLSGQGVEDGAGGVDLSPYGAATAVAARANSVNEYLILA
jgi:hypothetical protein